MTDYVVYTDGACDPNPGPGGWSAVFVVNGNKIENTSRRGTVYHQQPDGNDCRGESPGIPA